MQDNSFTHIVIIFLLTLITINLFILDLKVFTPSGVQVSDIATVAISPATSPSVFSSDSGCPASCINLINATSSSASEKTSTQTIQPKSSGLSAKEYYIPLGSGTTQKSDWEDVAATETLIDPSNYPSIKEVYFVASVRNPTQNGQIEAQLYNVTDKNPVWNSHMIMKGPASQTIQSEKITLPTGTKLYRVQLKSSLQFQAFLDNAKIRIITE